MKPTRGIRNNNPGNIDYNPRNNWLGQLGIEDDLPKGVTPRFAKFKTPEYGIRAMYRLLVTYIQKHNLRTIEQVISRYAPTHENKTDAYVANVSKWSGIGPREVLDVKDTTKMVSLIRAMIRQENGYCPYDDSTIKKGILL